MKNLKAPIVGLVAFFALILNGLAQQDIEKRFPLKAYGFDRNGDVRSMVEMENMFLSKDEREPIEEYDKIRMDTLIIHKRLGANDFIIGRSNMPGVGLLHREILVPGEVAVFSAPIQGNTVEEVEAKYKAKEYSSLAKLEIQHMYSNSKKNEIEMAPGLDEITRDDLIKSLSWREELGETIKAIMEQDPETSRFRVRSMVEAHRNQKLVLMGYNPYKQVVYNWEKQFEGDEEVIELLTTPISFE
ncbi:hypothetical protein [Flagellimonas allohymeniacidonis]|uniref:Uncharacterized protein n=1 Tax=Flagellimonas allohymeniacidonis TaxID=2517819 RepID=A0A4Q8QGN1_9FLAO|nr:hypothetical protein [Allomuricauda hymeniacidonis]TAI48897.1 hypothetical protein EW142_03620 [Allomuricauda hymeniacidonis]